MSKITKRKHVMNETFWDDYELPKENQSIVKVLKSRGNNLHEITTPSGEEYLVSMPVKFRKNIWVKRGDYILVEPITEGDKVKAEIVKIMNKDSIKYYKENNVWPKEFDDSKKEQTEQDDDIISGSYLNLVFDKCQGATIGVDFMIKTVEVDGEKVKLQIWDTAGQERFRSITQSYYRSAHALILVYDISCQPTFDCLPDWLREIEEYANNKVLRILVGNKTDREDREIPRHIGDDFAQRHGMYFLETSAKEAENVERLFMEIAVELMEQAKCKELPKYDGSLGPINGKTSSISDSSCCLRT
ncbi:unnamed protein product, partial [Brenthis ino]